MLCYVCFWGMQNSKFLQFVSKMSRGELIIDDNQVKPASGSWATEYQQQFNGGASWADEFVHDEASRDSVKAQKVERLFLLVLHFEVKLTCFGGA